MSVDATRLYNAGTQFTCFTSTKVQILTRLCNSAPYLHLFWSAPFQLCVATFLLYRYPDVSSRILTYPQVSSRVLTYPHVSSRVLQLYRVLGAIIFGERYNKQTPAQI